MAKKTSPKKTTPQKKKKGFGKRILKGLFKIILWFNILSVLSVIVYRFVPVPFTPLMVIRAIDQKSSGKEMTCSHHWVSLEEISPYLQRAVVASEDAGFFEHNGFDFSAMKKAYEKNKQGKKIRGGSTISQQTAKNVFLWPGRSYVRKVFEAYFTFLIEIFWSKKRILEVYLNSIEMGDGVYGAEAAAKHWYHKSAKKLNKYEAAGIAVILPNPRKYKPIHSSNYINRRKGTVAKYIDMIYLDY